MDNCVPYTLKECDCVQLYESVSYGTPLSPVFSSTDELKTWLLSNKDFWDYQWTESDIDNLIKNGWKPTLVISL